MKAGEFLRRTPFRLAATFSILFLASFIALFTVIYFGISARLESDIRQRVQETIDALAALDREDTFENLTQVVDGESSSVLDSDFAFLLIDNKGRFLAGNVRDVPQSGDWLFLQRSDIFATVERGEPDDIFFAKWRRLSKGKLLVGSSNSEVRQTQAFLLKVLGAGLAATALILGLMATYLARQAQHRIRAFEQALTAVSQGQMGARVPMTQSEDDIDQVALQVNHALAHLQKLIESVNQSSSDIAHDLKKPIGRLRQRLDEASCGEKTPEEFRTAIHSAIQEIDSITETFEALLRITQIEAGARKSRFVTVDLASVLDEVIDVYAAVAEDAGDSLAFRPRTLGPTLVLGDRELLVQLFANLVENAIRHCPAGTQIAIASTVSEGRIAVTVTDNGPGIPEAEREKVFRRLYRIERARSTPGSGLGLSLCAAIVDLHDAEIELADNAPGLRVELRFPRAAA